MKILAIGIGTAVVSGGLALYDHFKPKKAIQGGTSPGTQGKVILLGKVEKWAADQIHPSPIVSNPVSAGGSDPFAPKLPVAPNFLQSLWQADKITPPAPAQSYGTPN